MVRAFSAYLDFCYIARRSTLLEANLDALDAALQQFHHHRKIFEEVGVRPNRISLPRQYAMLHYRAHIENFGAPNGLCTSITESKHIKAVKKPWRRSSRWKALGQMLIINQRNNKMAAACIDFKRRGMLDGSTLSAAVQAQISSESDHESPAATTPGNTQRVEGQEGGDDDDKDDDEDKLVMSFVALAKTKGAQHAIRFI